MNRKNKVLVLFGLGLIVAFLVTSYLRKDNPRLQYVSGQTMGTIAYNVKFMGKADEAIKTAIDKELTAFNQSLSTYIPDSEISRLNKEGFLVFESDFFSSMLNKSRLIYEKTDGAFDPSIGPLVQAWGFGPDKDIPALDTAAVDSLKLIIGFDKVVFTDKSVSFPENFQLDFSAIAKGYAVDIVSELLEDRGIVNYLVEIGGEVRCRGMNQEDKPWSLGIEDPTVALSEQRLMAIVRLKDQSLATSGNYRNYYEKDGITYAHIIDPRTGYSSTHNLLSASVFADDCVTADAYATAFMVLGLEDAKKLALKENLDVFLLYRDNEGDIKSYVSEGIKPFLEMNKAN